MKPTEKQPTTDKPAGPANVPTQPAWKIPPKFVPVATPRTPVWELPSLEALAGIAATMATPAEKPASTARRAMELFAACERELVEMKKFVAKREAEIKHLCEVTEYAFAFLSNFNGNGDVDSSGSGLERDVSLDDFLKACMPKSKPEIRMKKFRDFTASQLFKYGGMAGLPPLSKASAADLAPKVVKRIREGGFRQNLNLVRRSEAFLDFIENDRQEVNSERGNKGPRARLIYATARAVIAGKELTPAQRDALRDLCEEEQKAAIDFLNLPPKAVGKWNAAIVDAKTPAACRPRVVKKSGESVEDAASAKTFRGADKKALKTPQVKKRQP